MLAYQCAEVLADIDNGEVLELGAGSGKLALDMLQTFAQLGALPEVYNILEVSPDLIDRQKSLLHEKAPQLVGRVRWLSELPDQHNGVIVANEVLDALPVERFVVRGGETMQVGVTYDDNGFHWQERTANTPLRTAVAEIQGDIERDLEDGFTSELALAVPIWIGDIAGSLQHGAVFLFDYGLSRREYYAPDRNDGWLRCHFRHRAHDQPLILPGIQDLTAWVDFSSVAAAATASGLSVLGYQTQSQFLLGGGLEKEMQAFRQLPTAAQLKLSGEIKVLTLPGEMGENFKCIVLGRGVSRAPSSFYFADRTQTL